MLVTPLVLAALTSAQSPGPLSRHASDYLSHALDVIQTHSLMRKTDWQQMRKNALLDAQGAQSPSDTYPAIRKAIRSLHDHHSSFFTPQEARGMQEEGVFKTTGVSIADGYVFLVFKGSAGDEAGVPVRSKVVSVNGKPVLSAKDAENSYYAAEDASTDKSPIVLEVSLDGKPAQKFSLVSKEFKTDIVPDGKMMGKVGYLDLPGFVGNKRQSARYAQTVQDLIRTFDQAGAQGWIVDLRRDTGGNMYPMIAGLGPLLGVSALGYFAYNDKRDDWWYRAGCSGEGKEAICKVAHPCKLVHTGRVAVLTSDETDSSGEVTLISFESLPNVKVFGTETGGFTTGNEMYHLSDGAVINLASSTETDRTGKTYSGPVHPDASVATDWSKFLLDGDEPLRQATEWLEQAK